MALKSIIQLFFLFLLVFLGACANVAPGTKPQSNRAPAAAEDQIIFNSSLKIKAHQMVYEILLAGKDTESAVLFCDKNHSGLLLTRNAELDLDAMKTRKLDKDKEFYAFDARGECGKFKEAIKFIDSGAPLIINLDRDRKKILTFFY